MLLALTRCPGFQSRQGRGVLGRAGPRQPETRTVEWPGEVDLDPEVLYGRFEPRFGLHIQRRTIREPEPTPLDAQ